MGRSDTSSSLLQGQPDLLVHEIYSPSFHEYRGCLYAGRRSLLSSQKGLSQVSQEHPPHVPFARHPGRADLSPYHQGIVPGNIDDAVEDNQGPAPPLPSAAVRSNPRQDVHIVYGHHPWVLVSRHDYGYKSSGLVGGRQETHQNMSDCGNIFSPRGE